VTRASDDEFTGALGLRFRVLRAAHLWSQAELAGAADLSRAVVSRLESGAHAVNILTVRHLPGARRTPSPPWSTRQPTRSN
jgi:DNA-binding XRE family transcriptional regulator